MENRFRGNPDQDLKDEIEVISTVEEEHGIMKEFGTDDSDGQGWSRGHMDAIQHMMETRPNPWKIMIERARFERKYLKSKLGKKEYTKQMRAGEILCTGTSRTFEEIHSISQWKPKSEEPLLGTTEIFIDVEFNEIIEE